MVKIRSQYLGRELVLHISPGTPSMHTIWVLMAETGCIDPPFTVVKSYRLQERGGRPAIVPVEIGIETFYKIYKTSRPRQVASDDQGVTWDPGRFQTEAMKKVYQEACRFAKINVPVLIRGERGTGKTTLAGWIRSNSPFRRESLNMNWPSVACGQYSPETMRAELFGYKKGSFTGAMKDKEGLLAAAHKDTLFLDEIGDISRDLQRLLIKAIEEKEYMALGDDSPKKSNFRLLTATNIENTELRRRLDPDFFDRISLLTIDLPPLRSVTAELPWLWETVYQQAAIRAECSGSRVQLGAVHHHRIVRRLQQHPLPGNLRDLFRVSYRILAARNDTELRLSPEDSVEYGMAALEGCYGFEAEATASFSKQVAAAFANSAPIDNLLESSGQFVTSAILDDYKSFLASELRRIAAQRQKSPESLCDVSDRTLRSWNSGRK
jgi:DNA-binding NtrC family response regulator